MRFIQNFVIGAAIALALAACSPSQKSDSTAFQPTQSQPVPAQQVPAQPVPAQPSTFQPDQAQSSTFQPDQAQTSEFKPTLAQVNQAQQDLGAQTSDREVRIVLPADVLFDFDKSNIRSDAAAALTKTLTVIRYYDAPIRIEGYTDSKGDDAYNQTLSEQRAESVKQWLIAQGKVASDRMTTAGFGETQPRAPNTKPDGSDDPAGRQLNRRVEIVVEKQ